MIRIKHRSWKQILAALLCAALLCAFAPRACADGAAEASGGMLDEAALTEMVEDFLAERGIPAERIGIGFCYLETGDEYFYNPDAWFYPASMYKVPLMMLVADRVSRGELTQDSKIDGMPVWQVEEYILTYSNNDWAHNVRNYLGGDAVWRAETMGLADLPTEYYDSDFIEYGFFSPRYMTKVFETLYYNQDRFPNVNDCLLNAMPANYFHLANELYNTPIAQKYGSYCDDWGKNWNGTAGIIYTEHPFVLNVMTLNVPEYEWVIGHFALLFRDYVLSLEEDLPDYQAEQAKLEEERLAAEQAEAERRAAEEAERARLEQERLAAEKAAAEYKAAQARKNLLIAGIAAAVLFTVLCVLVGTLLSRRRKRRRYEGYRRRFEEELRQEARRGGNPDS